MRADRPGPGPARSPGSRLAPFIVTLAGAARRPRARCCRSPTRASTTYLIPDSSLLARLGQGTLLGLGIPGVDRRRRCSSLGAVAAPADPLRPVRCYAIGGDQDAAALMGAAGGPHQGRSSTCCPGCCAGLAGALNAAWLSSGVTILGTGMELEAIAAVVIGGTLLTGGAGSSAARSRVCCCSSVIQNLINQIGDLSSSYQQVVSGALPGRRAEHAEPCPAPEMRLRSARRPCAGFERRAAGPRSRRGSQGAALPRQDAAGRKRSDLDGRAGLGSAGHREVALHRLRARGLGCRLRKDGVENLQAQSAATGSARALRSCGEVANRSARLRGYAGRYTLNN